jgi:hypothetical protein
VFKSKRVSLLTIFALLLPSSAGIATLDVSAANADAPVTTTTVDPAVLSDDASSVITVNGVTLINGDSTEVDFGTTSVDVVVTPTDSGAGYVVKGATGLDTGDNLLDIMVTAADGVSQEETQITVTVLPSNDTSITGIQVDGYAVEANDIVDLDPLTTDVEVDVATSDVNAAVAINGGTDLVPGENDLFITVTAADGVSTQDYYVMLNVLPNTDTSLSTFTVNGSDVSDGDSVDLDPFTTSVDVGVVTADPNSTFVIDGDSNLIVGENTLTVTVTAADDSTTMDYTVTLVVAPSNDASLNTAFIGFTDASGNAASQQVVDGDEVYLPSNTQSVDVSVIPTDSEATFEVQGDSGLQVGSNDLVITITAPDQVAQEIIDVTLIVAVGDVTTSSFNVNGTEVEDGMVLDVDPGTEAVEVMVETTDPLATTELTGDTGLVLGNSNHLVLTVTSVDGTATATYDVVINVLPYTDATAKTIMVNGNEWTDGNPVEVDAGDLSVDVEGNSPGTTFAVTGNTSNVSGLTTLTVTVTAQDGETTQSYDVEVLASTDLEIVAGSVPTDGTIRVGTYAKVTKDQFAGSKVTYQWLQDRTAIDGATSYRYLITPDDFGHQVRVMVVQTTAGVAKTLISKPVMFEAGIIKKAPTPGVKGKAVVGGTLTAVARTWSTDVELAYQWYRDGTAIDGATEDMYDLVPADMDAAISVGVTGSLPGYASIQKMSAELTVKAGTIRFTTKPSLSGDFVTGGTIEVDPGSTSVDAAFTYVWSRNGEVIDNTEATYTLTPDDFKKRITVEVDANTEGYNQAVAKVKSLSIKAGTLADVPTPSISGDAVVGNDLTVDLGGDYPDGTTFKYVWSRDYKIIAGANEAYTVNKRDIGKTIRVRVIATIPGYNKVSILAEGVVGAAAN